MRSGGFDLERLVDALSDVSENVVGFSHTDSTHACATRLLEQLDVEEVELGPTVVVAGTQSRGAGRQQRHWQSPPGGLYLSWIRRDVEPTTVAKLPMIAAAAAHRAVAACGVRDLDIKWPNDLLVDGRKIAGLLVHARHGSTSAVTVGLGVNLTVAPDAGPDALHPSTCLADHVSGDPGSWLDSIARSFVEQLAVGVASPEPGLAHWRDHLLHRPGDRLHIRLAAGRELSGRFVGVDADGFLRLDTEDGEQIVSGGDVVEWSEPSDGE